MSEQKNTLYEQQQSNLLDMNLEDCDFDLPQNFEEQFQSTQDIETNLNVSLEQMKTILRSKSTQQSQLFRETCKHCLPLFKQIVASPLCAELWLKYTNLTAEMRQLKAITYEQTSFVTEQIDIAIKDLELAVAQFNININIIASLDSKLFCRSMMANYAIYNSKQQQLTLLNTYAIRINSLRKEIMQTEMRIKHKQDFFQRLSNVGNNVFPQRKEQIQAMSALFVADVEQFIQQHFVENGVKGILFELKHDIKCLQALAKLLTLNTLSFSSSRKNLSNCWDQIKAVEQQFKRSKNEQKELYQAIQQHLEELKRAILSESIPLTIKNIEQSFKQIYSTIDEAWLSQTGRKSLLTQTDELQKQWLNSRIPTKNIKTASSLLQPQQFQMIRQRIEDLLRVAGTLSAAQIKEQKAQLQAEIETVTVLTKSEQQLLEKQLRPLNELLIEKKVDILLSLSNADQQLMEQLQSLLNQKIAERKDSKAQLAHYRKAQGVSGLDFKKSLDYQELMHIERQRLERIEMKIQIIQNKLDHIKNIHKMKIEIKL